ncbi:hypothetical protein FB45DRAFT_919159 [Roridomyces roridus]|uniref:Uncharacterized protein n=1 Tax=Roridomyces roridus TaxID=1738132 RepID=A0AAD7FNA1_9AGAR|nr:hypothetical protein FB45DRAFT_919159 [Roridomyces roridus]
MSTAYAQCSLVGYIGAFNNETGAFIGAVARALGSQGIFTLDTTGVSANYLGVIGITNDTNTGTAVLLQIISPVDANVPFVGIVAGFNNVTCFGSQPIPSESGWAAQIIPTDGSPRGPFPEPGDTKSTLLGDYGTLSVFCGEPMAFTIRSNLGMNTLIPIWTDQFGIQHTLIFLHDTTNNRLSVSPSLASYAAIAHGPVPQTQEVVIAIFT